MEIRRIRTALLLIMAIAVDVVTSAAVMQNGCEPPTIANGRLEKTSRRSARGPMFKYSCRSGYSRQGHMFNVCLRGRWVLEHAVCVGDGRGCDPLPSPEGGSARLSVQKDVTTFTCQPGYQLVGDATLHCDGERWNGTAPICQGPGARPWEAGARAGGGSARLFSARLPASARASGCVRFWHRRRHRQHPGSDGSDPLAVYALVEEPSAPSGQLRVALQGTDGNTRTGWTERVVPLPAMEIPYQVVIEATRPARRETDVELDDVTLMHGDECGAATTNAPRPPPSDRHTGGMSSRYREGQEWTRVWQSTLHISDQDEASQTPDSPDHISSGDEAKRTTAGRSSAVPSSTSSGNGERPQSISPRRRTGFSYRRDRVRRPGVAKHAPESPSTTSRPRAILPPSPGQRTHGAIGSAGFPARTRRPVTRVRWPVLRGRGEQGELMPNTAAGDEEVTPAMASGQPVERGVRRQGRRLGHFGAFGEDGDGDADGMGTIDDGGDNGDCGDAGCSDYDDGSDGGAGLHEDGITGRDSQENRNRGEYQTNNEMAEEDNARTMFPMQTNSVSDKAVTIKSSSQVNRNALDSSNAGTIAFPRSESHVRSISAPLPGLGDPMNTMPLNDPSVLSTPPKINRRKDKTDMRHEMITEKTTAGNQNKEADSNTDKSSAILFPDHAGNKNDDSDSSAATSGLPFYIVIAAAVGGCLLIITMVSVVLARRRRGVKVPVVIVEGSVFEPAPSDRSPIAELMRQNRLDHQPVVPAPVRL